MTNDELTQITLYNAFLLKAGIKRLCARIAPLTTSGQDLIQGFDVDDNPIAIMHRTTWGSHASIAATALGIVITPSS